MFGLLPKEAASTKAPPPTPAGPTGATSAPQPLGPPLPQSSGWHGASSGTNASNPLLAMWSDAHDSGASADEPKDDSHKLPTIAKWGDDKNGGSIKIATHDDSLPSLTYDGSKTKGDAQIQNTGEVSTENGGTIAGGSTTTVTTGDTTRATGNSGSISGDGTVAGSTTSSTTVKTGDTSQTTSNTAGMTLKDGIAGLTDSFTKSNTDADGKTRSQTIGGGADIDKNGIKQVSGSYSAESANGNKFGLNANIGRDGYGGGATFGNERGSAGVKFDVTQNKIDQDAAPQSGDQTSTLLGSDYISTTRTDSISLGLDGSFGKAGISGGIDSGSKLQVIEAMEKDKWNGMKEPEKKTYLDQQSAALKDYTDGIAGCDLRSMKPGTGVHVTNSNGWNAGGNLALGTVSINGGVGQTTASDVTIVRPTDPNAPIMVEVGREEGVSVNGGAGVFGIGLDFKDTKSTAKQTQFSIDPKMMEVDATGKPLHPDTYNEVQNFLQTGVMPGADHLSGQEAKTAYSQFDQAKQDVVALTQQIAAVPKESANEPAVKAQMQALLKQLDNAQSKVDINRNYLNDEWQKQNGAGAEPVPGIKVQAKDDKKSDEFEINAAGIEVSKTTEDWTSREYLSSKNTIEHLFGYDYKSMFLGATKTDFSSTSDTNTDGTMLAMRSGVMNYDNYDVQKLAAGIEQGTAKDFMLSDKNFREHNQVSLTIALDEQQLTAAGNTLNDPKNPQSVEMWKSLGARGSDFWGGGDYWADLDPSFKKLSDADQQAQRNSHGIARLNIEQEYFYRDQGPASDALHKFGATPEEAKKNAAACFAKVTSPEEFQKLTSDQQQLFLATLHETSRDDQSKVHGDFDALAPLALIPDPKARAAGINQLVGQDNEASVQRDQSDAGWDYLNFLDQRFKDSDPATYKLLQKNTRLDFSNDQLKDFENKSKDDVTNEIKNAYNSKAWVIASDPDEDKVINGMVALVEKQDPKAPPGTAITEMVKSTGMDPMQMLDAIPADKPAERKMYLDMMDETPYGLQIHANLAMRDALKPGH